MEVRVLEARTGVVAAATLAEGPFRLPYARPPSAGRLSAEFRTPGAATQVRFLPSPTADVGTIRLTCRASYRGTAMGDDGQKLVQVRVDLVRLLTRHLGSSAPTDASGAFVIPMEGAPVGLDPEEGGTLRFLGLRAVFPDGRTSEIVPARVDGLDRGHTVVFSPTRGTRIRVVRGAERAPVSGARILWQPDYAQNVLSQEARAEAQLSQSLVSDADGMFRPLWPAAVRWANIAVTSPEGTYTFGLARGQLRTEGDPTELVLSSGSVRLLVEMVESDGRTPVGDAGILLHPRPAEPPAVALGVSVRTDTRGRAETRLGGSDSVDLARVGLETPIFWQGMLPDAQGDLRYVSGFAPLQRDGAAWKAMIQVPTDNLPLDLLWISTADEAAVESVPVSLGLVASFQGRVVTTFAGDVANADSWAVSDRKRAWPVHRIERFAIDALAEQSVDAVQTALRLADGSIRVGSITLQQVRSAFNSSTPLPLGGKGDETWATLKIVDGVRGLPVVGAVVTVGPSMITTPFGVSLRAEAVADERGIALVPLLAALGPSAVFARDLASGRAAAVVISGAPPPEPVVVTLGSATEFRVRLGDGEGVLPETVSVFLESRPFYLTPRVTCRKDGSGRDWVSPPVSLEPYSMVAYMDVMRDDRRVNRRIEKKALEANGQTVPIPR